MSIATILDAQGAYEVLGKGNSYPSLTGSAARNIFHFGDRQYSFARGLFPEYDAYRDYFDAEIEYNEAKTRGDASARPPVFDNSTYSMYIYRAEEAIRIANSRL
jgi:hypothetical protein